MPKTAIRGNQKFIKFKQKEYYDPSVNKQQWLAHQAEEMYLLYGGAYSGGKTAMGINEGIALSLEYPGNVGFMGCRDGTDFKRNAMNQLLKFLPVDLYTTREYTDKSGQRVRAEGVHHQSDQYFKLLNGSVIYYGGLGNDAEAVKKISNMPELGWFFIDQAEDITENQFLLLCGRMRLSLPGIKRRAILTANPSPGWLRTRFISEAREDYRYIPALPGDNPFTPADYVKNLKRDYTPERVKQLLEGDWDVEGIDQLIPYIGIRDAIERKMPASGSTIAGLDVAEFGGAKTVFCVRQGNKVLDVVSWHHQDTEFSAGTVAELIRKHKLVLLNIDTIGKGGEVYVLLRNNYPCVRSVNVSEQASDPLKWINKRAEYYGKLAKRFENGEIDIPDHADLGAQLVNLRKKYKKASLQIESKELMRKRGEPSPDFADALMLAFIDSNVEQYAHMYVAGRQIW